MTVEKLYELLTPAQRQMDLQIAYPNFRVDEPVVSSIIDWNQAEQRLEVDNDNFRG